MELVVRTQSEARALASDLAHTALMPTMQAKLAERQRLTDQLDKSLQLQQWKPDIFRAGGIKFKTTSMGIQPRMTRDDFRIKCIARETGEVIGEWKGNEVPEHIFALMAPKSAQDMLTRPTRKRF